MQRPENRKAFVLLSVMLIVLVLGMVLRVAILRMPMASGLSRQALHQQTAQRAAQSGLSFALTMLAQDSAWPKRDTAPRTLVEDEGYLTVVQERGNVRGTITDPDGTVSEFRIRFNYQNGKSEGDPDGLADPSSAMAFDTPYVSINNLTSTRPTVVPRASRTSRAVEQPERGHTIPEISVSLAVEGRALGGQNQVLAKQVSEAIYLLAPKETVEDGVIMAGGGLEVNLSKKGKLKFGALKLDKKAPAVSRLRSKQGIVAKTNSGVPTVTSEDGRRVEFSLDPDQTNNVDLLVEQLKDKGQKVTEKNSDFYSLPADSIKKASEGSPNTATLAAGTYVHQRDLGSDDNRLLYYNVEGADYLNLSTADRRALPNPLDVTDSLGPLLKNGDADKIQVKNTKFSVAGADISGILWTIKEIDIKIKPAEGRDGAPQVKGFALVPETEAPFTRATAPETPIPDYKKHSTPDRILLDMTDTTISSEGDIIIYGGLRGKSATLTSEENVKLLAGRRLKLERGEQSGEIPLDPDDTDSDSNDDDGRNSQLQLNIYAQKDLAISSYSSNVNNGKGGYRDLLFKGLLYSWGNVDIYASNEGDGREGAFKLKGSLVAYGNDPETRAPGGGTFANPGKVKIHAKTALLDWDPSFFNLAALQGGSAEVGFVKYAVSFPKP